MKKEIDEEEYQSLIKSQNMLRALRSVGVDNWEGWDEACAMLEEIKVEQEIKEVFDNGIQSLLEKGLFEPSEGGAGWDFKPEVVETFKQNLINKIIKMGRK